MIFKPLPLVLFLCLTVTGCSKNPSESGSNRPPGTPVNPAPADGAVNQVVNPTLSWVCTDPDNDALIYDIYLGTQAAPPLLVSAFTSCSYHPSPLQYDTKYYWKIVAKDGMQHEIPGPVWSFMTMNQPSGVYTVSTFDAFCYINSVTVSGNYAYLGTANNNGLRILDISNPLSPREVGRIGNHETVGVMDISNNLAFLWCYGGNYASWMDIIDISNPASPSLKASYTPWQNRYLGDIEVSDGYAYLCLSTDYVEIVNIANSTNPIHQSVIYGISSTSTATADIFGHYLYVAERNIII